MKCKKKGEERGITKGKWDKRINRKEKENER